MRVNGHLAAICCCWNVAFLAHNDIIILIINKFWCVHTVGLGVRWAMGVWVSKSAANAHSSSTVDTQIVKPHYRLSTEQARKPNFFLLVDIYI